MKKMKLFLVLVLALLMVPFGVFADEDDKKEVNVYFFKGEGCGFCAAGLEWFDELCFHSEFFLHILMIMNLI